MKRLWTWALTLLLLSSSPRRADAQCFPAIFNFGDDDGDTGGIHASFPNSTAAESPPYGETYFGKPTGRNSDGRLIADVIAQALGLAFLDPYLKSVTSDYSNGVNFATWGATAQKVIYVRDFPLATQVTQRALFQPEVLGVLNNTYTVLDSRNLLAHVKAPAEPGTQPFKKLYNDLFVNNTVTTNGTTTNTSIDPTLHRALTAAQRVPLANYFSQGLYLLSFGTNDFKFGISTNQTTAEILAYLPNVVAAVVAAINELYTYGARNIVVSGVGIIGCSPSLLAVIPYTLTDLDTWGCLAEYNTLARNYNTFLLAGLANSTLSGANVAYLDVYQIQHDLLFKYSMNGMVDPIIACCGVQSTPFHYNPIVLCGESGDIANVLLTSATCVSPASYVDWDGIHYTDAANRYFAKQIFSGQYFDPPFPSQGFNCSLTVI